MVGLPWLWLLGCSCRRSSRCCVASRFWGVYVWIWGPESPITLFVPLDETGPTSSDGRGRAYCACRPHRDKRVFLTLQTSIGRSVCCGLDSLLFLWTDIPTDIYTMVSRRSAVLAGTVLAAVFLSIVSALQATQKGFVMGDVEFASSSTQQLDKRMSYGELLFSSQSSSSSFSQPPQPKAGMVAELLDPVAAFQEWKRHHSVQAIQDNPHNRSYIVAGYSCPRQVGVQLNDFLNGLLQAVVTNRTFLYTYTNFGHWWKKGVNTPAICDRLLLRGEWMPHYETIRDAYQLEPKVAFRNPSNAYDAHNKSVLLERVDKGLSLFDTAIQHHPVLEPPRMWATAAHTEVWLGLLLLTDKYASAYVGSAYGIENLAESEIVKRLYSEGPSFLYGMLLSESFQFTSELVQTVQGDIRIAPSPENEVSIAVHSRLIKIEQDGSDVTEEVQCLDDILAVVRLRRRGLFRKLLGAEGTKTASLPCSVYIMSDRELTFEGFAKASQVRGCHVVTVTDRGPAQQRVNDTSKTAEHGPFAGVGYFQDLIVASQARSAIISRGRSSSALLDEMIEYRRCSEAWEQGHKRLPDPIIRCSIGRRIPEIRRREKQKKIVRKIVLWSFFILALIVTFVLGKKQLN